MVEQETIIKHYEQGNDVVLYKYNKTGMIVHDFIYSELSKGMIYVRGRNTTFDNHYGTCVYSNVNQCLPYKKCFYFSSALVSR